MKIGGLGISALFLLLAGCGGAGQSITATPPPPPPPATPFPLKATASFDAISSLMSYNEPASANASFNTLGLQGRGAVTFSYDAASGTYTVQGGGVTASFGQGNQIPDTSYNDTFSNTNGAVTDAVKLYGNARSDTPGTPPVVLTYTSFGIWTHTDSATAQTTKTYFLYGQPTGAASMPTTGSASYQMTAEAHMFPGGMTASERITGTATLNANFGNGLVDTVLKFGSTYAGSGTISGDQFAGDFATNDPTALNGKFSGGFFGPGAKEAGFTFQIHVHNADPYAGATILPQDVYIVGAAAGPKG
jgi:hypothetical protein